MPTYVIRAIDADLWRKFKSRAALDGLPLRSVILALIRRYVEHGLEGAGEK
jgi:hypothetical protein